MEKKKRTVAFVKDSMKSYEITQWYFPQKASKEFWSHFAGLLSHSGCEGENLPFFFFSLKEMY